MDDIKEVSNQEDSKKRTFLSTIDFWKILLIDFYHKKRPLSTFSNSVSTFIKITFLVYMFEELKAKTFLLSVPIILLLNHPKTNIMNKLYIKIGRWEVFGCENLKSKSVKIGYITFIIR